MIQEWRRESLSAATASGRATQLAASACGALLGVGERNILRIHALQLIMIQVVGIMASEVQTPVDCDDAEPEQPAVAPDTPVEERKLGIASANQDPAYQRERPELVHELGHEILVQRMMPEEALASL